MASTDNMLPEGTGAGMMIGGILGGLIAAAAATTGIAVGVLTVGAAAPLVIGPLTTILAGMGAGGVVGGLVGALVGAGIPEASATEIDSGAHKGGSAVGVTPTGENRARVETGEVTPRRLIPSDETIPPRRTVR
jgi:hypothetical protein